MSEPGRPAGQIIYKALVPTLNMALCIITGFAVSKTGVLPPGSTKGISIITMNVALPCLIFSSMVSAFTPDNVSAFGPLAMMAIIYQVLGLLGGLLIKELCYVPQDFRWGIIVMGVISNWGNLPTAVVQTLAKEPPFDPSTDVDLGVAYIAVFMLIMNVCFWTLGLHKLCGWDFEEQRRIKDPLPLKTRWVRRFRALRARARLCRSIMVLSKTDSLHPAAQRADAEWGMTFDETPWPCSGEHGSRLDHAQSRRKHTSEQTGTACSHPAICCSKDIVESRERRAVTSDAAQALDEQATQIRLPNTSEKESNRARCLRILCDIPGATWAVVLGVMFSLVQPLKALLTETPNWTGSRVPNAPDGHPPLSFLLDTTKYLGAVTVPLALIVLGSSFARLKIPTRWTDLPILAIVWMTALKMILIPVFSVHTGMFPPEQKIRTFVAILLSGTPAAANQLVITQLYNPNGTADTLASFLLLQYICMFILSTGLAAIALYIVN